eukprot:scaffold29298_cov152-Skeletonema_dohrnii-CCMP3373.AAC.3
MCTNSSVYCEYRSSFKDAKECSMLLLLPAPLNQAAGKGIIMARRRYYNYTGEDGEVPWDATHVIVDKSVTVIPEYAFDGHNNIEEVVLHNKVKRIETEAFQRCRSLMRVIMPGVEVVERWAFNCCEALMVVECGKLKTIKNCAFCGCESLVSIDLTSVEVVGDGAFQSCEALTDAKFGNKLERFGEWAFYYCESLERIAIPFKDGMITHVNVFAECHNLKHLDLVEGELHLTIAALQLEEWRNDMYEEIDSINQILPDTSARGWVDDEGQAWAIRTWVRSVLRKIVHYIAEHQRLLNEEGETTLQLVLPQDIVMNNVLPFLELPSFTFEVGNDEEEDGDDEEGGGDEDDAHLA